MDDLITEAVSLPLEDRACLVDALLQTLNPVDESVSAAWLAAARRRLDDLDAGRIEAVSGEWVFEEAHRRLTR